MLITLSSAGQTIIPAVKLLLLDDAPCDTTDLDDPECKLLPYTKGIYSIWSVNNQIPDAILNNDGITGIFLTGGGSWAVVEPSKDAYDFALYDQRIAEAQAAGKKLVLAIPHNAGAAPQWLLDSVETFVVIQDDCENLIFPVFWDTHFRAQKLELIQQFGARYTNNETVVAVSASFAGTKTGDWNINTSRGECDGVSYHNTDNWIAAGYSTELMLEIAREVIQTTATAFAHQSLKISIAPSPVQGANTTKFSLAKQAVEFGSATYPGRFYPQASNLNTNTRLATDPDVINATEQDQAFLHHLLAQSSPNMGWQMVDKATNPGPTCRLGAGAIPCPETQVLMQSVMDIALSYQPSFIEVWSGDGQNSDLTDIFIATANTIDQQ